LQEFDDLQRNGQATNSAQGAAKSTGIAAGVPPGSPGIAAGAAPRSGGVAEDGAPQPTAIAAGPAPGSSRLRLPIDDVPDWQRIGALIVIFLIVIVFWMVFHQNGTTITAWANDNTDWQAWGLSFSGIISNAINPFWVVTLTFPL